MRTRLDAASNVTGVMLGNTRRPIHRNDAATAGFSRAIKTSPGMSPRTGFNQAPARFDRKVHGTANVLIRMVAHARSDENIRESAAPIVAEVLRNLLLFRLPKGNG